MEIPEGIKVTSDQVCKLNKALYGLKQAARCWYERFDIILKEKGFFSSKIDPCIYLLNKNDIVMNIQLFDPITQLIIYY